MTVVIGWREEMVIATEGSTVSLFFGYRKGTPSSFRYFEVEISGDITSQSAMVCVLMSLIDTLYLTGRYYCGS